MLFNGDMALAIFGVIILVLLVGIIVVVSLFVKNVALKVVLIVLSIIVFIIIGVVGAGIIAAREIANGVSDSVSSLSQKDKNSADEARPKLASTGEKKEVFATGEKISGNGVEITVSAKKDIQDGKANKFIKPNSYCAFDLTIKNIHKDSQNIGGYQFQLIDDSGKTTYPASLVDTDNQKYNFSSLELESGKESQTGIAFDCAKLTTKPQYLLYKGGELLNFSIFVKEEDRKFTPIKVLVIS